MQQMRHVLVEALKGPKIQQMWPAQAEILKEQLAENWLEGQLHKLQLDLQQIFHLTFFRLHLLRRPQQNQIGWSK
jgi:hypothetical protein